MLIGKFVLENCEKKYALKTFQLPKIPKNFSWSWIFLPLFIK